jgi:hypothetical protein
MKSWDSLEKDMKRFLGKLESAQLLPRDGLDDIPKQGVYAFYEKGRPIYVGRSNRLRERILEHGRPSSTHNSAPFAFNIARYRAKHLGIDIARTRQALEKDSQFQSEFQSAKRRVATMGVRILRLDDQVMQAIFEIYASIQLGTTKYNSFFTH